MSRYSEIDELYHKLVGKYPTKSGQAMERLTNAAFQIVQNVHVKHNQFIKSNYSDTEYQLDGLATTSDGNQQMIESKDYLISGNPVGRGDLQKQEGALTDLDMEKGIFSSATDYTKDAKEYAKGTHVNPRQTDIDLYHVRPSTSEDEGGRIKEIQVNLIARWPDFQNGKWEVLWTGESKQILCSQYKVGQHIEIRIDNIYDEKGVVINTLYDITTKLNKKVDLEDKSQKIIEGTVELPNGHIYVGNTMMSIEGIKYSIPIYNDSVTFVVKKDGTPAILIKSEDGSINKLLTDEELKKALSDIAK